MKIWGYWATFGWALLAFIAGLAAGTGAQLWLSGGQWSAVVESQFDGRAFTIYVFISNLATISMLCLAVWLAGASLRDYFALLWPSVQSAIVGFCCAVVLIIASDLALYLGGRELVTSFQMQTFTSALSDGWFVPMTLAAVLMAPAGEEFMFRGFLFRGWVRPGRATWPAIVVISILWAVLHVQYDWIGIFQVFAIGIFLGWTRLRSGSALLTMALHAMVNLEGTIETAIRIYYFRT
jgi:membrane protease YdiL (CAAX protease family)